MTITIKNIDKIKANRKAKRDANIQYGLLGMTRTDVYKNKKLYDRKRDKIVIF